MPCMTSMKGQVGVRAWRPVMQLRHQAAEQGRKLNNIRDEGICLAVQMQRFAAALQRTLHTPTWWRCCRRACGGSHSCEASPEVTCTKIGNSSRCSTAWHTACAI